MSMYVFLAIIGILVMIIVGLLKTASDNSKHLGNLYAERCDLSERINSLVCLVEQLSYAEAAAKGLPHGMQHTPGQTPAFQIKGVRPSVSTVVKNAVGIDKVDAKTFRENINSALREIQEEIN